MTGFKITETKLKGAYIIDYFSIGDKRGSFSKIFEKDVFQDAGISFTLNESFVSVSEKNVIRGLHFQTSNPQAKIVSVLRGKVWDVIVDLRMGSPTYKEWVSAELSSENHKAFFVPKGFAHGFVALEDESIMLYQCDGKYDKDTDTGIIYDDPKIGIEWPVSKKESIHSDRDLKLLSLDEYELNPMNV